MQITRQCTTMQAAGDSVRFDMLNRANAFQYSPVLPFFGMRLSAVLPQPAAASKIPAAGGQLLLLRQLELALHPFAAHADGDRLHSRIVDVAHRTGTEAQGDPD